MFNINFANDWIRTAHLQLVPEPTEPQPQTLRYCLAICSCLVEGD